jgi:hypothetical protein
MTANLESTFFTTIIPLGSNGFFAPPRWDDVLQYSIVDVSLVADTNCTISITQSADRQNISSTTVFTTAANQPFNISLPIYVRYIRLRVDNQEANTQANFSLQTIYKNVNVNNIPIVNQQIFNNTTGVDGTSILINSSCKTFTFFGNVNGATSLIVQCSPDTLNWYDSQYTYTSSSSANFGFTVSLVSQYMRLKSTADVNCICYVNAI